MDGHSDRDRILGRMAGNLDGQYVSINFCTVILDKEVEQYSVHFAFDRVRFRMLYIDYSIARKIGHGRM